MSSLSFIEFYENEMNYLMEEGKRFKEKHPSMVNLDFSNTSCDPDVKRLIESVAFLNATLNKRIEEKNPELNQEILNSIYPHFNRPTPSFCIFNLENPDKQFTIKNGTKILSKKSNGIKYTFISTHSIKISSYNIINIKKSSTDNLPKHIGKITDSSIEISLGKTFNQPEDEMILFINSLDDFPDSLYESLFTFYKNKNTPVFENDIQIGEIVQMDDFDIFPTQDNENNTFKSIIEFNTFKQKLLFFKIKFSKEPISKIIIPISNNKKLNIKQNSFLLNCFVGVNIVEQISDPIYVDNTNHKYSIRTPKNHEIYTIKEIKSVENHDKRYINYFSLEYNEKTENDILWITKKTEISKIKTDLYLLNNNFEKHILYAKTLCVQTNANNDIDNFEDWIIPELGCSCINIKKPTKYSSNMNQNDTQRTLISHLFINYFGLDNNDMLRKLNELFNLYSNNENINHYFSLIHEISTETHMIPIKGNMIPKVYIIMKVEDDPNLFLLAQIIAKTLSNNMNLNSKLALTLIKNETNEVWKQCDII